MTPLKYSHRYSLLKGKYGCYFHDTHINVDLTLEMVLNKLNRNESLKEQKNFLINEVNQLKKKLSLIPEVK